MRAVVKQLNNLILPSKKEKIHQLLNVEQTCPYCGSKVIYMTGNKFMEITEKYSDEVNNFPAYMENADMLVCSSYPYCNSYCIPSLNQEGNFVGKVANKELRKKRQLAHYSINIIWKTRIMSRRCCYYWLSRQMRIRLEKTHISLFSSKQCDKAIAICYDFLYNNADRIRTYDDLSDTELSCLRTIFNGYWRY